MSTQSLDLTCALCFLLRGATLDRTRTVMDHLMETAWNNWNGCRIRWDRNGMMEIDTRGVAMVCRLSVILIITGFFWLID